MIKMYLLSVLGFICYVSYTNAGENCIPPKITNGYVSGAGSGNMYVGSFSCNPGFTLVGEKVIKCRAGVWSADHPICTSIGKCDPADIPHIPNGHKRSVKKFRGSVYRFKCSRGYQRYGASLIHCSGDTWNINDLPVCAKPGCDGAHMEEIPFGRVKRLAGGAVYKIQCDPGATMVGSSLIYCDGKQWNDTVPRCLVGPSKVTIDGSSVIPNNGDSVYSCVTAISSPAADIQWTVTDKDGNDIDDSVEVLETDVSWTGAGWITTSSIIFSTTKALPSVVFKCTATTNELEHSVSAKKHVSMQYAPDRVTVTGPQRIRTGEHLKLECYSSPSVPSSTLKWRVESSDQVQEFSDPETQISSLEDGSFMTRSFLNIPVTASQGHDLVVECYATNEVLGNDFKAYAHVVEVLYPPSMPIISGLTDGTAVVPGSSQLLTCSAQAGSPPATLQWYQGKQMMDSLYEVAGDVVKAQITFVPHHQDTELRCEASNEALSEPISKTIVIAIEEIMKPSVEPVLSSDTMADDASNEVNPNDEYDYSHFEYVNKYFEKQFEKQEYEMGEIDEEKDNNENNIDDFEDNNNDYADKDYSYTAKTNQIEEEISKKLEDNFIENHIDIISESPMRSENTASDTVHNLSSPDHTASDVSLSLPKKKYANVVNALHTSSAHSYKHSFVTILTFTLITRTLLLL